MQNSNTRHLLKRMEYPYYAGHQHQMRFVCLQHDGILISTRVFSIGGNESIDLTSATMFK